MQEAFFAWLIVIGASRLFYSLQSVFFIRNNLSILTAVFLLYVPIGIAFFRREKINYFDLSPLSFLKSLAWGGVISLIILVPAIAVNHCYQAWFVGAAFHAAPFPQWISFFFFELVVIALPEEFFFRGYLLGRFDQIFVKKIKLLGTPVGWGLPVVSLVFAVSHSLIQYQGWQILIFFPALLFGWLRERTGTITASVFFHAACNVFSQWVFLNYRG